MSTLGGDPAESLSTRLQAATSELQELERLVKSGELDSRVLREFRNAVDHIRGTAWAVQQWVGLQATGDPYAVLPKLSAERVRRATQIANDLVLDVQAMDVGVETEGIKELFTAIEDLHRRLAALVNREA
ncbi:MAG TPA: hypothetical protein VLY23_06805 [Candidatus Acidoferrum sp.]|nr:hypothetical protein [Candidatus Acidoferrum sp.]